MSNEQPTYNQIWMGLLSTEEAAGYYPIVGSINTLSTATFAPKNTIGDYTKDSEDYISSWILSDLSGGVNVEDMNEGSDSARSWTAFADTRRPGKIALNTLVERFQWSGASGTAYPLGVINNTVYGIIGSEIAGWDEGNNDFFTEEAVTLTPIEKPVAYAGELFAPCGASGYMSIAESAPGNPAVTDVTTTPVGFPASYDPDSMATDNPAPVAFWVFDQRLWALTTSGALAWSFTGDNDDWNWPYDEARAWYPRIQSGEKPQRIIGFYNPDGKPALVIITDRGAYLYNWSIPSIDNTPVQFPPHPDFGGAVCVWRAGEDLHIGNGMDSVRYTSANVVVPLSGLSRDDGVPQELRGQIVDFEPETSEMFALVAPSSSGATAYTYNDTVGSAGTGNGQFNDVRGLSVDSAGNVFACDFLNERVQEFGASLTYAAQFGSAGSGNGEFATNNGPYDCAHDSADALFVVDRGNHRVQKFNAANAYVSQFGEFDDGTAAVGGSEGWVLQDSYGSPGSGNDNFDGPGQVAVDSSGNVYIADSGNGRLKKHAGDGAFVGEIAGLTGVVGVCVDNSGSVYVTVPGLATPAIRKYDASLSLQWASTSHALASVRHIATDSTRLYVVVGDQWFYSTTALNATPTFASVGSAGSGNGQFNTPIGIATNGTHVWVVDSGNNRVQQFTTAGAYVSQFAIPADCRGIALDSAGRIMVARNTGTVYRYSSTGSLIDSFTQTGADGIAYDATTDTVWVTDSINDTLNAWQFTVVADIPAIPPANGKFNLPRGIAIKQSSGRIYVVDSGNHRVQYFDSDGVYEGKFGNTSYNASTGAITPSSADGRFNAPEGIAVNQVSGDVYVIDRGNARVQQFTATGTFIRKWGGTGTANGQFNLPTGIAVQPETHNVFVGDFTNDRVQEFWPTGAFFNGLGSSGTANGQFQGISGLAFNSTGDLYVADRTNEDVQEFTESVANATNTYPWLAAWTGIGWYGKWRGTSTAVIPTWAIVTSTPDAYRLWWGMSDGYLYTTKLRRYFHNPRQGLLAGIDEYEEEGEIITPRFDAAMLGNWKLASHMVVFMDNATDDEKITIEYRADSDGGWTELGSVTSNDKTYLPFNVVDGFSRGEAFNWIQFRIRLFRGSDKTKTPIIKSLVFCYIKIPQNGDAFNFVVAFPSDGYNDRTAHQIRKDLTSLVNAKEFIRLRLPSWGEGQAEEGDGGEAGTIEYRGYLTAVSGTDSPTNLPDGQRAVNFIRISAEEI